MKLSSKIARIATLSGSAAAVLLWIAYASLKGRSTNPLTYLSCETETVKEFHDLGGADFTVEYSNCDTLAKDEAIRVFASDRAGLPIIGNWLKPRTMLLWYDPGRYDSPLPEIMVPKPGRLLITVASASSIAAKKPEWKGRQIDYRIGHIDFP